MLINFFRGMASRVCKKLDKSLTHELLNSIDYVLTDCDGVLWDGNIPIPGSVDTINALKNQNKHIIYVTNNSSKTREEYVEKCQKLGFPATVNNIVSTAYCAATYLKRIDFKKKVYVFGGNSITQELDKANIKYLPIGPDPVPDDWIPWITKLKLDPEVGAVIVAFDQHISYPKLTKAASYIKNPDNLFIVTNRDELFLDNKADLTIPGVGMYVAALEAVSGRKPEVVGKPEKFILDCVKESYPSIDFNRCLMIGDRLNTDIALGTRHGIKTLLVLTGINSLEDVLKHQKNLDDSSQSLVPDFYLPRLGDLLSLIQS